ncbi:MAG: SIS domain-containing protein [Terriglobia bacterium]
MDPKNDLLELPRALRNALEKGGPEYDKLVRQTHWGDGPVYVLAAGATRATALATACAFETLVGLPAIVRAAADFQAYSLSVLRPRSLLLVIEPAPSLPEILDVARAAKSRGARILALTAHPQSELAKIADGVFQVCTAEAPPGSLRAEICRHAMGCYLGLAAARALKRPRDYLRELEEEFVKLPDHVEWAFTQLSDAVRALAARLESPPRLQVIGGGFYFPAALHWAETLGRLKGTAARACDGLADTFSGPTLHAPDEIVVLLSGSRCRGGKTMHALAESARRAGREFLALTDKNDPEISRRASLAILLPVLTEEVGALLSLALLDWIACQRSVPAAKPCP